MRKRANEKACSALPRLGSLKPRNVYVPLGLFDLASDSEQSSDLQWCNAFIIYQLDICTGPEEISDDLFVSGTNCMHKPGGNRIVKEVQGDKSSSAPAMCNGVHRLWSCLLTSAPCWTRSCWISLAPDEHAQWRAVRPSCNWT